MVHLNTFLPPNKTTGLNKNSCTMLQERMIWIFYAFHNNNSNHHYHIHLHNISNLSHLYCCQTICIFVQLVMMQVCPWTNLTYITNHNYLTPFSTPYFPITLLVISYPTFPGDFFPPSCFITTNIKFYIFKVEFTLWMMDFQMQSNLYAISYLYSPCFGVALLLYSFLNIWIWMKWWYVCVWNIWFSKSVLVWHNW